MEGQFRVQNERNPGLHTGAYPQPDFAGVSNHGQMFPALTPDVQPIEDGEVQGEVGQWQVMDTQYFNTSDLLPSDHPGMKIVPFRTKQKVVPITVSTSVIDGLSRISATRYVGKAPETGKKRSRFKIYPC